MPLKDQHWGVVEYRLIARVLGSKTSRPHSLFSFPWPGKPKPKAGDLLEAEQVTVTGLDTDKQKVCSKTPSTPFIHRTLFQYILLTHYLKLFLFIYVFCAGLYHFYSFMRTETSAIVLSHLQLLEVCTRCNSHSVTY